MRGIQYLHPDLQVLVKKFVAECIKKGYPVLITETFRSKAEQDGFYAQGRFKPGKIITGAKYPFSPHCWGVAFDFCRNVKGREYDNSDGFFDKIGRIAEKMFDNTEFDLFWGGDWKNFVDRPHVEMKKYMPNGNTDYLIRKYRTPESFKKTWTVCEPATPHPLKIKYGFSDATIDYIENYRYSEDLVQALLNRKVLSAVSNGYIKSYKYGAEILNKVYN